MKAFKVKLPEIGKKNLLAFHDSLDKELVLKCNGVPLEKNEDGKYFIADQNGDIIEFSWETDFDDNPVISANGVQLEIEAKLTPLEWILAGLPLLLVPVGGLIGGVLGGLATFFNLKIMRAGKTPLFKYPSCIGISVLAFAVYALLAVILNLMFGFSTGMIGMKNFSNAIDSMTPSELESSMKSGEFPDLYADNPGDSAIEISIDGSKPTIIEPFTYASFRTGHGRHKCVYSANGKILDSIDFELPENKVAMISPEGATPLTIISASYSTNNFGFGGSGEENVTGKNFVVADFGILEPIPEKITVKLKSGEFGKTFTRTKITKTLPQNPGSLEAYVFLTKYHDKPANPYTIHEADISLMKMLLALGEEPKRPEHAAVLLDYAAKSKGRILEAALTSLDKLSDKISDQELAKFAVEDEKVSLSGLSYGSPAAYGRSGWALKKLVSKTAFNCFPTPGRACLKKIEASLCAYWRKRGI